MAGVMTWHTKSNSISGRIAQFWMRPPRENVMHMQLPAPRATILTRPVIADNNLGAKSKILGILILALSYRCMPALPAGMVWARQHLLLLSGNRYSVPHSRSHCSLDGHTMFWRKGPPI